MSKIVLNNRAYDIVIADTGTTVPASGQYTIPPVYYPIWAGSDDIIIKIGIGDVSISDGSTTLGVSDGVDLIKGWCRCSTGGGGSVGFADIKSGRLLNSEFSGNPKKATVTFTKPLAPPFAVNITGIDTRVWAIESQTVNGFVINSNANLALNGDVFWEVMEFGES